MRGFFNGRSGSSGSKGKSKPSAKDVMIEKIGGKAAEQHKMKKMLEETIQNYTTNYIKSKDSRERGVHGEKVSDKPIELNKRTKDMITILATQKVQKDMKKIKQKEHAQLMEEKRKIKAQVNAKNQQQAQIELKKKADEAAAAVTSAKSYFFGNPEGQ